MPGGTLPWLGNVAMGQVIQATITPAASVGGASSSTSTYTINGLVVGDAVLFCPQAAITGVLSADAIWVSAANTLSIQWSNASASTSSASPTALTCVLVVVRPSNVYAGVSSYATSIT